MINVLADQNLYKISEIIPAEVELKSYDPKKGIPDLNTAEALLLRTVTLLNRETLPKIPEKLQFIGTGSSGTDHLDVPYLTERGIRVADAKGCNARAVAEYIMTALLLWKEKRGLHLNSLNVGIIGVGKVGTAVAGVLKDFEIPHVLYDPPRAEQESDFESATLDEVLSCEILSLHVPLNEEGDHPTRYWLDEEKLAHRDYHLIINAARGGVVREQALLKAFKKGSVKDYILDVWEREPDFDPEMAKHAFIATPHIAGYSEQAKIAATSLICTALSEHFKLRPTTPQYEPLPKPVDLAHIHYNLTELITRLNPILEYDQALRDLSGRPDKALLFQNLRTEWPYRYEYQHLRIREEVLSSHTALKKLGVQSLAS